AHAVKGMALRNSGDYAAAEAEFELSRKEIKDLPESNGNWMGDWIQQTKHPSAYYAERAEEFRAAGRRGEALNMLNQALAAAPDQPRLLAERGALHLNAALARGEGRVQENDADVAAAVADAEKAKAGDSAEAFYLSGRIAEALDKRVNAADDYGEALKRHPDLDSDGARYRAARARVLMPQSHGGQAQLDAAATEALKLADQILSIKGDAPFEARAQALAIEEAWTDALNTYVDGLRPHISQEQAEVLQAIVQGHPALKRPTSKTVADPLGAAQHYAAGLQWFNDREYEKAEQEFLTAVEHDGQDARYYYYLGLSRLMQGDREAFEDFVQGAKLERQNHPSRAAVSAALERVQGEARERLNEIRDRPR
ncbi:MAG TPA: hypothetical protein VMS17_15710, partial [Gemmataceae bacterium]|nr:hypothetical protein [Gemmataceae bacterium]